jgi:TRAP transporter TAXI family solute receptor
MSREIWAAAAVRRLVMAALVLASAGSPGWTQTPPAAAPARTVAAPDKENPLSKANANTIMIVTGGYDTNAARIVGELAGKLNTDDELRVLPAFGQGSVQNVSDLLNLRGIDLAIVQSDVLAHFQRTNSVPGIETQLQYLSKLHSEEFHVLSRMRYLCLAELDGRKVNFGPRGSGASITAEAVFEAHKINVLPLYLDQTEALEKLKTGEIDATVYVDGKPSRMFDRIRYTDRVHFLDVEYTDRLQRDYLPTIMTYDDYPQLIAPKETVSTIAVSNVLAFYNSRPTPDRLKRVGRFVERFFAALDSLKQAPGAARSLYHPKWQEVNIFAPAPGWQRFPAAQAWVAGKSAPSVRPTIPAGKAPQKQETAGAADPSNGAQAWPLFQRFAHDQTAPTQEERRELFNQFLQWYDGARKEEQSSR